MKKSTMSEVKLKLAPQCRMMKIAGVDIIGNPDTNTIIGLDQEGLSLVNTLQQNELIDITRMNENQIALINELSSSGFFSISKKRLTINSSYLHVTSHCNLRCPGCYSFESNRNAAKNLTLNELKYVLDNLVNAGLRQLVISGGEPFIRDDLVHFLAYAKSKPEIEYIECISNGTMAIEKYREASKYLDVLTFSLDSADAKSAMIRPSQSFDAIVEKLILLKSENVPMSIVFTIHHGNVTHCDELMNFAHSLNTEYRFSILTVDSSHDFLQSLALNSQDYQLFHEFVKRHQRNVAIDDSSINADLGCTLSCGAGKSTVSIASDGTIYPCHMFVGKKNFSMGNSLYDDIQGVINSPQSNPFYPINVDCVSSCHQCHVRYICGGGCRFRAYALTGDIKGFDPMCKIYMDNKEWSINCLLYT